MKLIKMSELELKSLNFLFNPLSIVLNFLGQAEYEKKNFKGRVERQVVWLGYDIPKE